MKELIEMWNEADGTNKLNEILECLQSIKAQVRFLAFAAELMEKETKRLEKVKK